MQKPFKHVLAGISHGDILTRIGEKNYYLVRDGVKQFELFSSSGVIEDIESFDAFCDANPRLFEMMRTEIKIKRREGPIGELIFPRLCLSFEEADKFLATHSETIDPNEAPEFRVDLRFTDDFEITVLIRLTKDMLEGRDEEYTGLLSRFMEDVDYLAEKSWFQKEKEAMKKCRSRLEIIGVLPKSVGAIEEKKAA